MANLCLDCGFFRIAIRKKGRGLCALQGLHLDIAALGCVNWTDCWSVPGEPKERRKNREFDRVLFGGRKSDMAFGTMQ